MINELDITVPVKVVGYIEEGMGVCTQVVPYEMAVGMAVMEEAGEYHPDIYQKFFQDDEEFKPTFTDVWNDEGGVDWVFTGFRLIEAA